MVPDATWFDGEYKNIRKLRRKAEKKFKKSGVPRDRDDYIKLRKETTELAYIKKEYYKQKLDSANSSKTLYSFVNQLLDNKRETVLPTAKSNKELADSFIKYFCDKITTIRAKFKENTDNMYNTFSHRVYQVSRKRMKTKFFKSLQNIELGAPLKIPSQQNY